MELLTNFLTSLASMAPNGSPVVGSTIAAVVSLVGVLISSFVAIVLGLFTSWYVQKKIGQREDWGLVFDIFDKTHKDEMSAEAILLLDYDSYPLAIPKNDEGEKITLIVTRSDVYDCLRVEESDIELTAPERYVRDCFDCLFVNLTQVSMIVNHRDIKMRHVDSIFGFFFARMRKDGRDWVRFKIYLSKFFYHDLISLIEGHWKIYGNRKYHGVLAKDRVLPGSDNVMFSDYVRKIKTEAKCKKRLSVCG